MVLQVLRDRSTPDAGARVCPPPNDYVKALYGFARKKAAELH